MTAVQIAPTCSSVVPQAIVSILSKVFSNPDLILENGGFYCYHQLSHKETFKVIQHLSDETEVTIEGVAWKVRCQVNGQQAPFFSGTLAQSF